MRLEIRQDLRRGALRAALRDRPILSVSSFLEPASANYLCELLSTQVNWSIGSVDETRNPISVPAAEFAADADCRAGFLKQAEGGSPARFRYLYASHHLMKFYRTGADIGALSPIVDLLTSADFVGFVSSIFGSDVSQADAHLANYQPGHFLNRHTDAVAPIDGRQRAVAFVLNFSRRWRSDWGGLTTFWPDRDLPGLTYTPEFNSALFFRVPIDHAVGIVAQAAPNRLSVAGWLHELICPHRVDRVVC